MHRLLYRLYKADCDAISSIIKDDEGVLEVTAPKMCSEDEIKRYLSSVNARQISGLIRNHKKHNTAFRKVVNDMINKYIKEYELPIYNEFEISLSSLSNEKILQKGKRLLREKKYREAEQLFKGIDNEDAKKYLVLCRVIRGLELGNEVNISTICEAIELFPEEFGKNFFGNEYPAINDYYQYLDDSSWRRIDDGKEYIVKCGQFDKYHMTVNNKKLKIKLQSLTEVYYSFNEDYTEMLLQEWQPATDTTHDIKYDYISGGNR